MIFYLYNFNTRLEWIKNNRFKWFKYWSNAILLASVIWHPVRWPASRWLTRCSVSNATIWLQDPLWTSAVRSKRTRRLACVGLCVLKEVLVVTSGWAPFPQKKSEKLYPIVVLNHWRDSLIFIRTGVRPIQEVVVLVLKCALAITAVMAIYCLAIVLMERLSDWFHIGEVTVVK